MEILLGPTKFKTVRNQLAKILHISFNITPTHEQGWDEYTKPELATSTSTITLVWVRVRVLHIQSTTIFQWLLNPTVQASVAHLY